MATGKIERFEKEFVDITALSGYEISYNRSVKIGKTIFIVARIAKTSGTLPTAWTNIAKINNVSFGQAFMSVAAASGSNDLLRCEISPTGVIAVQQTTSNGSGTGAFINMCIGV